MRILSASCLEGMSTAYTQDPHVTTLRETSSEIVCSLARRGGKLARGRIQILRGTGHRHHEADYQVPRIDGARCQDQERTFGKVNHGKSASILGARRQRHSGAATSGSSSITTAIRQSPYIPVLTSFKVQARRGAEGGVGYETDQELFAKGLATYQKVVRQNYMAHSEVYGPPRRARVRSSSFPGHSVRNGSWVGSGATGTMSPLYTSTSHDRHWKRPRRNRPPCLSRRSALREFC